MPSSSRLQMKNKNREWSRYYHIPQMHELEVLHAQFVDHRYALHTHDYFVVALVETGAASYWYRGAQRVAGRGQVFVVNPDEPHTGDSASPDGYIYRVLYPRTELLADLAADAGTPHAAPFFTDSALRDNNLASLLSMFHQKLANSCLAAEYESLVWRALSRLAQFHTDPQITPRAVGGERPAVRRACDYIQSHFAEDVSISKLARLASLSPYYFARAFEQEIGLPPHTYLENVRIQKAREFLDQGHTLASAALLAGYVDQSHLTNRFRRFLGITPGQYVLNSKRRESL